MTDPLARSEGKTRSAMMISFGALSEMLMPFVRSVALAHLISPEQFGLAITLALAAGFSEVITDIGLNNSAMRQDKDGGTAGVLPTLHTILLARAVLIGAVLALGGLPLAYLFGAPEAAWSFSLLGLAAIIRGFHHLEPLRMLRDFVYGPDALSTAAGHFVWTVVTIAAAFVLDDYRCMLAGIIAGALAYVLLTHLYSKERWSLGWSPEVAREALSYGAPLVPNGIALAIASMGDRFLIGSFLGVAPLAFYNASSMAAFMPRGVVLRLLGAVAMPLFLKFGRERVTSARVVDYWGLILSGASSYYSLTFLCFGPLAIKLVFGAQYAPDQLLVTCIALSVYMKFMMTLPQPLALVFGQTGLILASTIVSSIALVCAAGAVLVEPELWMFVFGLAVGELLAVVWAVAKGIKIYGLSPKLAWFAALFPVAVLAGVHAALRAVPIDDILVRFEVFALAALVLGGGYAAAFPASGLPWYPVFLRKPGVSDFTPAPSQTP